MKNITVPEHLTDLSRLGQSGHSKAESSDNQRKIFWHGDSNCATTPCDCHFELELYGPM